MSQPCAGTLVPPASRKRHSSGVSQPQVVTRPSGLLWGLLPTDGNNGRRVGGSPVGSERPPQPRKIAPGSPGRSRPALLTVFALVYGATAAVMLGGCGGLPPDVQPTGAIVVFAAFEGPESDAPTIRSVAVVICGGVRGLFDGPAGKELILREVPFGTLNPPQQPLTVTAPGYLTVSQQVTLRKDAATFVEVNMTRVDLAATGTVAGTVRSLDGGPIVNALVTFSWQEGQEHKSVQGFTDRDGRFIIGGIAAGDVEVEAAAAGFLSATRTISVWPDEGGSNPNLNFELVSGTSTVVVRGTVRDLRTEAPLAGAQVTVGDQAPVVTGGDGTFEVRNVLVGSRPLAVRLSGYDDYDATIEVLPGMAPVEVRLSRVSAEPPGEPYTVTGTVTLLGRPNNAGATVVAFDRDRAVEMARATTDVHGNYRLFLPPGRYELTVSYGGKSIKRELTYPGGGRVMEGVNFTLTVGG